MSCKGCEKRRRAIKRFYRRLIEGRVNVNRPTPAELRREKLIEQNQKQVIE